MSQEFIRSNLKVLFVLSMTWNLEDCAHTEGMEPVRSHVQQVCESIVSGEKLRDNEVNIGLLNTSIVLHKMFAVILWSLFAHIRSEMTSVWDTGVLGRSCTCFNCVKKIFIFQINLLFSSLLFASLLFASLVFTIIPQINAIRALKFLGLLP